MTLRAFGRAIVLALSLLASSSGAGFSHALPGSVLLISHQDGEIRITAKVALEDLIVALPTAETLQTLPVGQQVPKDQLSPLRAYFASHLTIQKSQTDLGLSLTDARLETAGNQDVGTYIVLAADLSAKLPGTEQMFPITLIYDAVMHEVRNHRATVYWMQPGSGPVGIADFGFRTIDGKPRPVELKLP